MQKKLIALAITAAFSAPAFADTTVYGVVDTGFGTVSNTHTTTAGVSTKTGLQTINFSQLWTTRFGIKNTEDLNNGMKLTSIVETNIAAKNPMNDSNFGGAAVTAPGVSTGPTATTLGDRILDLALDLGQGTTILVGKMSSPLRNIAYGYDAFYGSNLVGNLVTMDGSLTARAVAAGVAQNFGAVTATLAVLDNTSTKDGTPDIKYGNGFEATATFKQNALAVSAGYRSTKATTNGTTLPIATNSDTTTKDLILGASFDFGMAKLYGQFATVKVDQSVAPTTTDKKTYETLGVNVPFTPVLAGYVQTSFGKHDTGTDSPKMTAFAVGAKYDFSKNTSAYADVGSAKSDQTALTAGSKVEQIAIGLVHSF
ncbi:MAG TPA: porin [Gallionella sp.]